MSAPHRLATPLALLIGVVAVGLGAQVSIPVPGSPVPQSLQTLAVVLVGAVLGPVWGGGALVLYVAIGAVGLPVFADGAAGAEHLVGPTAGYLAGFVLGAGMSGFWPRLLPHDDASAGIAREAFAVFAVSVAAHAAILGAGWLRLAALMSPGPAWTAGVAPFLVGGLAKSVLAAALWPLMRLIPPPHRTGP